MIDVIDKNYLSTSMSIFIRFYSAVIFLVSKKFHLMLKKNVDKARTEETLILVMGQRSKRLHRLL